MAEGEAGDGGKLRASKRLAASTRAWVAMGTAFVAVLGAAAWLFWSHRQERLAELQAHYARLAAHIGKEVELKYANSRQVVDNVTRSASAVKGVLEATHAADAAQVSPLARPPEAPDPKDHGVLPSYVQEAGFARCGAATSFELCIVQQVARIARIDATDGRRFEFVPCAPDGIGRLPVWNEGGASFTLPPHEQASKLGVCGKIASSTLFAGRDAAASEDETASPATDFDVVLLAGTDGTVLHAYGLDPSLNIRALPKAAVEAMTATRMVTDVELGHGKYRLFLQPTTARFAAPCAPNTPCAQKGGAAQSREIVLAGLVSENRLQRAALRISPAQYLWAALLLGFGILSLPLAKLWLLGPTASYRRFDVMLLVTSAVVTTLLAVVLLLAFASHSRLGKRLDDGLARVSAQLERRLAKRIEDSRANLVSLSGVLDPLKTAIANRPETDGPSPFDRACSDAHGQVGGATFDRDDERWPICEVTGAKVASERAPWKVAFLMNERGYQQVKVVPAAHATNPVSLADRRYFREAKKHADSCLDDKGTLRAGCDFPEIVRSVTSGSIVLIVARPVAAERVQPDGTRQEAVVAAIETPLDNLRKPVLPIGVQVAVIDARGKVMLHSDNDTHHGQNFFDDVDDANELRSSMVAGVSGTFDLSYFGVASRVHVRPLRGMNWFVLSIATDKLVDLPTGHMLLVTLVGYTLFSLIAIVLMGLAQLLLKRSINLVPSARRAREYTDAGFFMLAGATLLVIAVVHLCSWLPMAVPLSAAALLLVFSSRRIPGIARPAPPPHTEPSAPPSPPPGPNSPPPSRPALAARRLLHKLETWSGARAKNFAEAVQRFSLTPEGSSEVALRDYLPFGYALCCAGLSAVFVVVPATVLFVGAYDHVVEGLARAEQIHYARALRYRQACLDSLVHESAACSDVFGAGHEIAPLPVASPRLLVGCAFSPTPCLMDLLPPLDAAPDQSSGRLYRADALGWKWVSGDRRLDLLDSGGKSVLATALPLLVGSHHRWVGLGALLLVFVLFVAVAFVATFHSTRRLLFLELLHEFVQPKESAPTPDSLCSGRPRQIVLFPGPDLAKQLEADPRFVPLSEWSAAAAGTTTIGFVTDLGKRLADEALLCRLEAAVKADERFVVLSGVDPLRHAPPALSGRWAALIEPLHEVDWLRQVERRLAVKKPTRAAFAGVWASCDEDEKRVLAQLAFDGYAGPHPANASTVRDLARRGLLDSETLQLPGPGFGDRFRKFIVGEAVSAADRQRWAADEAEAGSIWHALRIPLTTGVALLVAALSTSQPELAAVGAAVPTLAASMPAIMRVLSSLAQFKGTK